MLLNKDIHSDSAVSAVLGFRVKRFPYRAIVVQAMGIELCNANIQAIICALFSLERTGNTGDTMKNRGYSARFVFITSILLALILTACVTVRKPDVKPVPEIQKPLTEQEKDMMELEVIYRLAEKGELKEASSRISALSERKPDNDNYKFLHVSLLVSMQDYENAKKIISDFLMLKPDNVEALFLLAEIERFSGNSKNLASALEKIILVDAKNLDALAGLGDLYYESRNYKKAEEYFAKALAVAPGDVASLTGLARVQYRREDYKGAKANLDKAVAANPDEPLVYLDRSRVNYQLGNYTECETDLNKSIEIDPNSSWNYLERGRLYLDTGRRDLALKDFNASIELDPGYFLCYVYRAAIFEETGRDVEAYADYKKVTELNKEYWYAFESMGVLAFRQQLWKDAFSAFDKAAGFTDVHSEYYIAAGMSLLLNKDYKAAKEYSAKVLPKINREKEPAQWLMLRLIYDQNETTTELELKISSEKSMDTKAALLFYLGEYWITKGRPELGAKYLLLSLGADRQGTIEWRMAEAEKKRLGIEQ